MIGLLLSQENSESFTWQEYFITQEAKKVHNRKMSKPEVVTKHGRRQFQRHQRGTREAARGCMNFREACVPRGAGPQPHADLMVADWLGNRKILLTWRKLELCVGSESAWRGNRGGSRFSRGALGVRLEACWKPWPLSGVLTLLE